MDFLKELFGSEAITFEQFLEKAQAAGKDGQAMKLVDLTQGGYRGAEKYTALEGENKSLASQLEEAGKTIEAMKTNAHDVEAIQKTADKYKEDAEKAKAESDSRVAAAEYRAAAIEAASSLQFSSASAKRAFINDLVDKCLPVDKGQITGFNDFERDYRESDPDAFKTENATPPPRIVAGATPAGGAKGAIAAKLEKYQ